ncbi:MAG: 50S ribosomal protein L18 [Solirubrobacterales bacterium]
MAVSTSRIRRARRRRRVRAKVRGTAERPRLAVYRSNRGLFVQLIDDGAGNTLAQANWTEAEFKDLDSSERATKIGEALAERAKGAGVSACVFDRGGYRYHGRVAKLAAGAREGGLRF